VFDADAPDRLAFIGAGKRLGLPLEEIAALLDVRAAGVCRDVRAALRPRIAAHADDTAHRIAELTAFTATLHTALAHLDALPDSTAPCTPACDPTAEPTRRAKLESATPRDTNPEAGPEADPEANSEANSEADPEANSEADPEAGPEANPEAEAWRTAPVACSLTGGDRAERASAWRAALDGAVRTPIPDGVRLTLPAGRAAAIAELAAAEQACCAFFDIRVHFAAHALDLEVRGPAAATDLLAEVFGPYA
jgi:hypothetical protein